MFDQVNQQALPSLSLKYQSDDDDDNEPVEGLILGFRTQSWPKAALLISATAQPPVAQSFFGVMQVSTFVIPALPTAWPLWLTTSKECWSCSWLVRSC
jgi:hypothetical protein